MVKFATHCDPNPRTDCALLTGRSGTGYFMQRRTGFTTRIPIAALAFAASAIALAPSSDAAPAETCLKAPKGVAPQGSHWYYRIDRATQHHCWYLGEKGAKTAQRSRTRSAPAQAEPDDADDDAAPAPVASAPTARSATAPTARAVAAPTARVAPAATTTPAADDDSQPAAEAATPKITTLVTRNVSNADQPTQPATAVATPAAPLVPPAPMPLAQEAPTPTSMAAPASDAPAAAVQTPVDQPAPRVVAEQPQPPVAPQTASAAPSTTPTLLLVLGGIAFFGLIASAAFFILTLLRRRNDVLHIRREADVLPYEHSPDMAAEDGATFPPLRALDPIRRRDDVDEAMQRVMRRRRAAA